MEPERESGEGWGKECGELLIEVKLMGRRSRRRGGMVEGEGIVPPELPSLFW
jgi:hypothetical protein